MWRGRKRDDYETEQMNSRIKCRKLTHKFKKHERKEAVPCAHCGARLYLQGRSATAPQTAQPALPTSDPHASSSSSHAAAPQTPQPQPPTGIGVARAARTSAAKPSDHVLHALPGPVPQMHFACPCGYAGCGQLPAQCSPAPIFIVVRKLGSCARSRQLPAQSTPAPIFTAL